MIPALLQAVEVVEVVGMMSEVLMTVGEEAEEVEEGCLRGKGIRKATTRTRQVLGIHDIPPTSHRAVRFVPKPCCICVVSPACRR